MTGSTQVAGPVSPEPEQMWWSLASSAFAPAGDHAHGTRTHIVAEAASRTGVPRSVCKGGEGRCDVHGTQRMRRGRIPACCGPPS